MADSEKKVGITVSLKDKVTAGAKKVADGFKNARKGVAEFGKTGEQQLKTVAKAVVVLNQGLALVGKVWGGISRVVGQAITQSLEMRAETDQGKKSWTEMLDTIKELWAFVGDFFIPVVLGIYDAFQPVIASAKEWLGSLRETQGAGFVEWLMDFGRTLISVVAKSVVVVTRTWTFLSLAVRAYQLWVQKAFGAMITGASKASGMLAKLAEKVGLGGIAGALRTASDEAGHMAAAFRDGADKSADGIDALLDQQRELERTVGVVEAAVSQAFGSAGPRIMARMKDAVQRVKPAFAAVGAEAEKTGETIGQAMQKAMDAVSLFASKRADMWNREADAIERNARLQQDLDDLSIEAAADQRERTREMASEIMEGYGLASGAARDFYSSISEGSDAMKAAIGRVAASLGSLAEQWIANQIAMAIASKATAKTEIATSAAAGGAKAVEAHAGIPFVGAVIGAAAAALIFGIIMAFASGFQHGGIIGGNGRMGDRHLIMAEQGESVLDRETTGALVAALSGQGRKPVSRARQREDGGGRSGGGQTVVINHKPQMLAMPNSADYQRNYRDSVLPVQRRLAKLGAM